MISNLKGHHFDFGRKGASINVSSPSSYPQSALASLTAPAHQQNRNALANMKREQGSTHFKMGFDAAERPVTVANSLSGSNLISVRASARMSTINAGASLVGGHKKVVGHNRVFGGSQEGRTEVVRRS